MTIPARTLRLAAAAYPIEMHRSWAAFEAKLTRWGADAEKEGATCAVLPEYAGMEAAFVAAPGRASVEDWCHRAAAHAGRYLALCASVAQRHRLLLLSGSLPTRVGDQLVNRAFLCRPDGVVHAVDKQVLTPWEAHNTPLVPGPALPVIQSPTASVAALICYDGEFPPLAHALNPDILLMPACTEAPVGDSRLRVAARARALELQAVTLHAPLIGAVPGCEIVDQNTGCAGIYAPPDTPFPSDGILAQGAPDTPGWVVATLAEGALSQTRTAGSVAPRHDMQGANARAAGATARPAPELAP